MVSSTFFSEDYIGARNRFRTTALKTGAKLSCYRNPCEVQPALELTTDVARLGGSDSPRALVLISGTHGVEGFCGSACQLAALEGGLLTELPEDLKVVLVHALNPYGFACLRRTTEDNVDLNRNFVDHRLHLPRNDDYDRLHPALVPALLTGEPGEQADQSIAQFLAEKGERAYQAAITGGQYHHIDGLFYGGKGSTWSRQTLKAICSRELAYSDEVFVLDYHTGLGAFGALELILPDTKESAIYQRASNILGDKVRAIRGSSADSLSASVNGSIDECFRSVFEGGSVTYLGLEYGTLPIQEVLSNLRAENWYHHYGHRHSDYLGSKQRLRDTFLSQDDHWQKTVIDQSQEIIPKVTHYLSR